jgi:hypothetical protein
MSEPIIEIDNPEVEILNIEEKSSWGSTEWKVELKAGNVTGYLTVDQSTRSGNGSVGGVSFNYTVDK